MAVRGVAAGGVGLIVATTILLALASTAIGLRFLARIRGNMIEIDDWAALLAFILLISVSVCHCLIGGPYGYAGHPQAQLSAQQLEQFLIVCNYNFL